MQNRRTSQLSSAGVSIWLDDLSRRRLNSGSLAELVKTRNVVGVTTNPTIFANAIGSGDGYSERIASCATRKLSAEKTAFELMCADVADACDVLRPVYEASNGQNGRVSIEVSPDLANDSEATIQQALQLWTDVNRPNAMIKIPATLPGLHAIRELIGRGISVNVTLIFSLSRYRQVINAYLSGLEQARASGLDLTKIQSVASFFVSRVDTLIDNKLDELESEQTTQLRSKAGLANARLAYEVFEEHFSSERSLTLLALGANKQRPLWASTGVKDPTLIDTLYVEQLVAADVVNTMPESTLQAFADHGHVSGDTIASSYRDSDTILNELDGLGIDYLEITDQLETEGIQKFETSWKELLAIVSQALQES